MFLRLFDVLYISVLLLIIFVVAMIVALAWLVRHSFVFTVVVVVDVMCHVQAIGECIRYLSLSLVANSIKEGCINWRGKGEHANRTWFFVLLPDRLLVYPFQPRPNASRPELFQTYLLTPQSAVTNTDYTAFSLSHLQGPCPEGKEKEKEKTEGTKGANDVDAVCLSVLPMNEKERAALPSHCFDFMLPLKAECDSWMSACNKAISTLKYRQQQQSAK